MTKSHYFAPLITISSQNSKIDINLQLIQSHSKLKYVKAAAREGRGLIISLTLSESRKIQIKGRQKKKEAQYDQDKDELPHPLEPLLI